MRRRRAPTKPGEVTLISTLPTRARRALRRRARTFATGASALLTLALLGAVAPPRLAGAAPTATPATGERKLDVVAKPDGTYEVRDAGVLLWQVKATTAPLHRGTTRLRQVDVDGHRIVELRVPVRGRPREEVFVAEVGVRPPRPIWSGLTGPKDADEEVAVHVEVGPDQIVEYQTADQVSRCDGETPRLFPRAYDFDAGTFRPIVSTPPEPAGQKLTARRGDPEMPTAAPIGGFRFTSASTTLGAGNDARQLGAQSALDDGDPATVWAEGLGGDGRGEFLTARSAAGRYRVRGLRIVPGDASTAAIFRSRNRIRAFALVLGPEAERRFEVEMPEDPASSEGKARVPYWVPLPRPVESSCVTVVIRDVYRGTEAQRHKGSGGTTAISDLQIFTELDTGAGVDRLISDTAAGADCAPRVPLLVSLGEPVVLPAAQALLAARGVGRACLIEALAQIEATPKSVVAVDALAASVVGASAREEQLIVATLRKSERPPVRAMAEVLLSGKQNVADRERAARVLGELDATEAAEVLLGAIGQGPPVLRLATVQALGRSPRASVHAVVTARAQTRAMPPGPAADARESDLLRVLPLLVRRFPADRPAALASIRDSLANGRAFEVRARAVAALGAAGGGAAIPELARVRTGPADPVLRYLAARELADIGGPAAIAELRAALRDADPRVREAAARGLGRHRDAAAEPLLVRAAKEEPWPFVRRAQIEAMAQLCGPPAKELLMRAVERDVEEVRRAGLAGLVRCRDPRARPLLLAVLKSRRTAAPMRELSAALIGELGDKSIAPNLARIVDGLVTESEGDLAIEGVVVAALRALGHLGGAEAATVAARLANDDRHPYRQVAIEVLGQLCDRTVGEPALAKVRAGGDVELSLAAQAAEEKCRR